MYEDQSENQNEAPAPSRSRTPLGDVTNNLIKKKRPFSSLSSSPSKSVFVDTNCSQSGLEDDTEFWNKVALVVEQLENKKVNVGQGIRVSDDHFPRLNSPLVSPTTGFKDHSEFHKRDAVSTEESKNEKVNVGQRSGFSDDTTGLPPLNGGKVLSGTRVAIEPDPSGSALDRIHLDEVMGSEISENGKGCQREVTATPVVEREDKAGSCRLVNSHSFSLERCSGLNHGGCSNLSADVASLNSLNSCSCTFCTKVAYIWSDLHYKDVKDRISVSVKSQKDASDLAQRYILETEMSRHSQGTRINVGNTEPDLTTHWKSLFLHLENVFGTETSLLQADLQCLRGIRDDFKINLEMINAIPVDVHPCSSDSSGHVMI